MSIEAINSERKRNPGNIMQDAGLAQDLDAQVLFE